MHRTWNTNPLHSLYKGASKIATFVECHIFRATLPRNGATFQGFSACCIGLIESEVLYNFWKKFGNAPSDFRVITALHVIQTRYCDENSVCPSVARVISDKTVERSVQIFIPYERTFSLVLWEEEWLVGGDLKFLGQPALIGAKSPIFNR